MRRFSDNCHRARIDARHAQHIEFADEVAEDDCAVARHSAVFLVKLDGLRIMAGQNWWVLHNTAAVSA